MLAHWNNSPRVDMSHHSDTLSWLRANQSLLFLLNAAGEATHTHFKFIVFGLTRSNPRTTARIYVENMLRTQYYVGKNMALRWTNAREFRLLQNKERIYTIDRIKANSRETGHKRPHLIMCPCKVIFTCVEHDCLHARGRFKTRRLESNSRV